VKKISVIVFLMAMLCTLHLSAQTAASATTPAALRPANPTWDYGLLGQSGFGVTEGRSGFGFFTAGAHLGRVITSPHGNGLFRGQFEYAVEVFPFWQSYTPVFQRSSCVQAGASVNCSALYNVGGTFTGASITPILLRWNFSSGKKWQPWAQGAGGVVWTNHKYPAFPVAGAQQNIQNDGPNADASVWNFTPQGGVGAHYFFRPNRSVDFGANAIHISSASLGDRNPGVNASIQFTVGYSWWK
jgi:hypothetical protein